MEESKRKLRCPLQEYGLGLMGGYTWQTSVAGVPVIGFVDRTADSVRPDDTFEQDFAEFRSRLDELATAATAAFVVVDFSNYRMTDWDNGRSILGLVLAANRQWKARGGALVVCHHPAQLNPDLQDVFHCDQSIRIYRSQREAIEAARLQDELPEPT